MDTIRLTLTPRAPYAFGLALAYLRRWPAATLEHINDAGDDALYRRALTLDGQAVLLTLCVTGAADAPRLLLDVTAADLRPATSALADARVRRIFNLDVDPTPLAELARTDAPLAGLLARFGAVRPLLLADPFECVIWTVLGQQLSVGFARKTKLALLELCGSAATFNGQTYSLFPAPEVVAALDPAALLARQFSRQKVGYVLGLARAAAAGELDFETLRAMPRDEALADLMRQSGIGRWTAEYILMRGLGDPAVLPAGDVSLQALIGAAYLGRRASEEELRQLAEQWPGWAGWVAAYFWMARALPET